jgi:hypothetical protein
MGKLTGEITISKSLKQRCDLWRILFDIYLEQVLNIWYR